jgi:hypothetical protein
MILTPGESLGLFFLTFPKQQGIQRLAQAPVDLVTSCPAFSVALVIFDKSNGNKQFGSEAAPLCMELQLVTVDQLCIAIALFVEASFGIEAIAQAGPP